MKRILDAVTAFVMLIFLCVPVALVAILVRCTSRGPALHWSVRVGRNNVPFRMPKFRTMKLGTPVVATHLLSDPVSHLTPIGGFLRRSSLDELPQLYSVLVGDMSLVGPRPALTTQVDLIAERQIYGAQRLRPGITGWAQINGRDELSIAEKVRFDAEYLQRACTAFDLQIIARTLLTVLRQDGISH